MKIRYQNRSYRQWNIKYGRRFDCQKIEIQKYKYKNQQIKNQFSTRFLKKFFRILVENLLKTN